MSDPYETLTERQAAARWGIGATTLSGLRSRGEISFIPMPKGVRYLQRHWAEYLERKEVKACRDAQKAHTLHGLKNGDAGISASMKAADAASLARARQSIQRRKRFSESSSPNAEPVPIKGRSRPSRS